MKILKWLLISALAAAILVWGAWAIVLPESVLRDLIETPRGDISAKTEGLSKGLFFDFGADAITLIRQDKEILTIENIEGRINPLSLLLLKVALRVEGDLSGGRFAGSATLHRKGISAAISVSDADASGIAFLSSLGVVERGTLSGDLTLKDGVGEARFSLDGALLKDRVFSGVPLPLHLFRGAKAALSVKAGTLGVTSFSLEGEGIYARIKGDIKGTNLDLNVELMPEAAFRDKIYLIPLERYMVSPGYYLIPVKGDLASSVG